MQPFVAAKALRAFRIDRGVAALAWLWIFSFALAANAGASGRRAAMVLDANSGQVLYAQAADEPRYPASLTKMMTLYLTFELMEQGRLRPTTQIRISERAAATAPSKLGLEPGTEIALMDAVKAIITKSANDIAVAVAEHIAGSEAKFAALMTKRAHELGMRSTTFKNAHGLPDPEQVTTARDMVTLALHLNDDFPRLYQLFSLRAFNYNGATYRNHNTMLGSFEGMDGIKTGYTSSSGFNLVSSVRRDGKHVVAAIFGGTSASARNAHMRAMLNRALASASTEKKRKPVLLARNGRSARAAEVARPFVARAPAPKLIEPIRPAEMPVRTAHYPTSEPPVPAAVGPVVEAQGPVTQPMSGIPVEVARVRTVSVLPRARPDALDIPPLQDRRLASFAPASTSSPPAAPAEEAVAPQNVAQPQPVMTRRGDDAEPRIIFAHPMIGQGRAPSTLQAQAQRLDQGTASPPQQPRLFNGAATADAFPLLQPPTRVTPPEPAAPLQPGFDEPAQPSLQSAGREFAIQVGAYASEAEAQRQLRATRERSGTLLGDAQPLTETVKLGSRQLYRARFAGFDAAGAASTCSELKRLKIDCHVARRQ